MMDIKETVLKQFALHVGRKVSGSEKINSLGLDDCQLASLLVNIEENTETDLPEVTIHQDGKVFAQVDDNQDTLETVGVLAEYVDITVARFELYGIK